MRARVAVNDAGERLAEKFLQDFGGPTGAAGEEGERRGHDSPDPGFGVAFLGGRFVDVRRRLFGKLGGDFVIGGFDGLGDAVLQTDQPTGAGGFDSESYRRIGPLAASTDESRP